MKILLIIPNYLAITFQKRGNEVLIQLLHSQTSHSPERQGSNQRRAGLLSVLK